MSTRSSNSRSPSRDSFPKQPRTKATEGNVSWLGRAITESTHSDTLAQSGEPEPSRCTFVILLGAKDPYAFRLRHAQSVLRYDLTPSAWSHAAMVIDQKEPLGRTVLIECSLQPSRGFWLPTATNGLQVNTLDHYDDPGRYPNIALLRVPVPSARWTKPTRQGSPSAIETFVKQRSVIDVAPLLHRWLAHVWDIDDGQNPLEVGVGMPSAVAIEALLSGAGYDISPGLDSNQSSPEAFWQAARWWHPFFDAMKRSRPTGSWLIEHYLEHGRFPDPDADRKRYLSDPDGPPGARTRKE